MLLTTLFIIVGAFIIAALPLHLAVSMLGGKSSILKVILVNIIVGILVAIIYSFLPYASIIAFIVVLWVYREMFRLKWFKAFLAWIIQGTLTFLFIIILGMIFGVSLIL